MKYSLAFRNSVLRKVLPPESRSPGQVSLETGVTVQTIRYWLSKLSSGQPGADDGEIGPAQRSAVEKMRLLLESKLVADEDRGSWLRERGLHAEHLPLYEQELVSIVSEKSDEIKKVNRELKKEVLRLSRELTRKEKALAEVTALLVLKKKADAIWGDGADDSSDLRIDGKP